VLEGEDFKQPTIKENLKNKEKIFFFKEQSMRNYRAEIHNNLLSKSL